jgi:hypothetical protein
MRSIQNSQSSNPAFGITFLPKTATVLSHLLEGWACANCTSPGNTWTNEVETVGALLMGSDGAFITGSGGCGVTAPTGTAISAE